MLDMILNYDSNLHFEKLNTQENVLYYYNDCLCLLSLAKILKHKSF